MIDELLQLLKEFAYKKGEFKLSSGNKQTLERMINGSSNSCYKCGEKGHFANRCSYENEEDYSESEEDFEEGLYNDNGNTILYYEGECYEESYNNPGHRNWTVFISNYYCRIFIGRCNENF